MIKREIQKRFGEVFPRGLDDAGFDGFGRIYARARAGASEAGDHQAAYILATAYWESALTFQPVREGLCQTDAEARAYVCRLFDEGKISVNYAQAAKNGESFYGRGYVQLTWEKNYRAIGDHLIGDEAWFYDRPDDVMQPDLAAIIMVRGMVDGIFTEHRLGDHINRDKVDYLHARQSVNRMDRAETLAEWADRMHYVVTGKTFV